MYGVAGDDVVSELIIDGATVEEATRRLAMLAWERHAGALHPSAGDGFDGWFAVAFPRSPWGAPHSEQRRYPDDD
jgi:hypothetical protein